MYCSIASISSLPLPKVPRRIRLDVCSPKRRSTKLSHRVRNYSGTSHRCFRLRPIALNLRTVKSSRRAYSCDRVTSFCPIELLFLATQTTPHSQCRRRYLSAGLRSAMTMHRPSARLFKHSPNAAPRWRRTRARERSIRARKRVRKLSSIGARSVR
jgi:hypothetical protein